MNSYFKSAVFVVSSLFLTLSYADNLGQITVSNSVFGHKTLTYEQINDYAVVEGDILLGTVESLRNPSAITTHALGGLRWQNGIVPYEINELIPFENKFAILQAIGTWQKHSHIKFIERTLTNQVEFPDYISFVPAKGTTCASFVGRIGGKQVINLSPRCTAMNTVHELGHALGLWHEQSRADRDSYILILWDNIEEDHKYNFNQQLTSGVDFGEYDYQSIMHYGPFAFSKNGERTIIPLIGGVDIGQRKGLSEKDIAAISAMYPDI